MFSSLHIMERVEETRSRKVANASDEGMQRQYLHVLYSTQIVGTGTQHCHLRAQPQIPGSLQSGRIPGGGGLGLEMVALCVQL